MPRLPPSACASSMLYHQVVCGVKMEAFISLLLLHERIVS